MSRTKAIRIIAWIFTVITKEVGGAVSYPPSNAVAEVFGIATFNCSATPSGPTLWILTRDGIAGGEKRITTGCIVSPELQNHYRTEQPGGITTCNLIVFNITMEQAGVYLCTDTDIHRALLTVLENSPAITHNSSTDLVENDNVIIECSLNYNGSMSPAPTLRPHFYWTNSARQNISSSYDSTTENTALSRLTVTAARGNIAPYTCHVYFQLIPSTNAGYASNTPIVSDSASSLPIQVLYEPSKPSLFHGKRNITANDGSICTLTTLTCTSTANPPPNYTWKDVTTGSALMIGVIGYTFEWAEDNRTYECTATNNIRNDNKSSSATYTVGISSSRPCASVKSNDIRICSDDGLCDNGTTSRSCSNGSHIYLTINVSDVYPIPTQFQWKDGSDNILSSTSAYNATTNGDYSVLVYNEINQQSNTPAVANVRVMDCSSPAPSRTTTPSACDGKVECGVAKTAAIVLGVLLGLSLLVNGIFILVIIQRNQSKRRDQKTKTSSTSERNTWNQETVNHSMDTPPPPSTYQELSLSREQPTQYERLAADTRHNNLD